MTASTIILRRHKHQPRIRLPGLQATWVSNYLWTVLPRPRNLIFAKPLELMIVALLMATWSLLMSVSQVSQLLHLGSINGYVYGIGFIAWALVGLAAFGFSRLREQIARAKLTALQNEVLVS